MEEDGGVKNEAAKPAKRAENKGCSVACEPDLTCTGFFLLVQSLPTSLCTSEVYSVFTVALYLL